MVKVSIIMPAYNTERYVSRMIDSIIAQTMQDWELICVDDGSIDNTLEILKEYEKEEPRIKVIHQENKGCGSSRCAALRQAKGEYVICLDSDDWLEFDYIETLYNTAIKEKADLVWCDAYKNTSEYWSFRFDRDSFKLIRANLQGDFPSYVWNKIIKKEIALKSIDYLEGCQVWEDNVYCIICWYYSKFLYYVPRALYHYNTNNEGSIMHSTKDAKRQESKGIAIRHISSFLEDNRATNLFEHELNLSKLIFLIDYIDNANVRDYHKFVSSFPEAITKMNNYNLYPKRLKVAYWLIIHKMQFLVPVLCIIDNSLRKWRVIH